MKNLLLASIFFFSTLAVTTVDVKADADLDSYDQAYGYDELLSSNDERILNGLRAFDDTLKNGNLVQGEVVFNFGSGRHTVVCAVFELCDISLESGEKIRGVQLGDTERWSVDTAVSGIGDTHTEHLIIKPLDSGLKTSLIITTDRRAYHLKLKSAVDEYMPQVRFTYPKENLAALNGKVKNRSFGTYEIGGVNPDVSEAAALSNNRLSIAASDSKNAPISFYSVKKNNYSYEIQGDPLLQPNKIWNDGSRTYIKMNKSGFSDKLPSLNEVQSEGWLFKDEQLSPVNYRFGDNTFVIDGLPRRLRLQLQDGGAALSCDIIYKG